MRSAAVAVSVCGLLLTGVAAASPPPNFGVVVEDGIYRGGQPTEHDLEYLRSLGVKTILKLNDHDLAEEQAAATRLGLRIVAVPLHVSTVGSAEACGDVEKALAVLQDRANWPVYVHCTRGRDRTGYLVGVFRELVQHWPWKKVDVELASYGHSHLLRRAYPLLSKDLRENAAACDQFRRLLATPVPAE